MDAVLYMAMGTLDWDTPIGMHTAFDVNVKGVYLTLQAAHSAGVRHAVYCSSMSVYDGNLAAHYFYAEDQVPDARNIYGFTKYLGEQVCRNACNLRGISANALRLCFPTTDEDWMKADRTGMRVLATAASDVARAMDAALNYRNGFQAFMVSGEYNKQSPTSPKPGVCLVGSHWPASSHSLRKRPKGGEDWPTCTTSWQSSTILARAVWYAR